MKIRFIALLFAALALFATTAAAQTDWPNGDGINAATMEGQDVAGAFLFVAMSQSASPLAVEHNLFEFPAVLAEVKTFNKPFKAALAGGVACLACPEPDKGSYI